MRNIGSYYYDDPVHRKNGEFDVVLEYADGYEIYEAKYYAQPMTLDEIHREVQQVEAIRELKVKQLGFIAINGFAEEESPYTYLNGKDISSRLRNEEVGNMASVTSAIPEVRKKLLELQQNLAKTQNVIMDGRDIGTCVLPHADVKVYLTASVETRAKRRYQELQEKGEDCNLEEIAHDIEERDRRDMTREIAPLKQAEDAVLVDSSNMTIAEVVKTIVDLCR